MANPIFDTANYQGWFIGRTLSMPDTGPILVTETYHIRLKGGAVEDPPTPAVPTNFLLLDQTERYVEMVVEGLVPRIGQTYLSWSPGASGVDIPTNCYAVGTEIVSNKDGSITAIHTFTGRKKWDSATIASTPEERYPPEIEVLTTQRQAEEFRKETTTPSLAAPPSTSDKSATDIGGEAIKNGAEKGIITTYNQVRIRIRRHFDVEEDGDIKDFIALFSTYVGCRNSATFMGYTQGKVSFDGFNLAKVEASFYEVVFDFTFDEKFFHSQVPEYDIDGIPKMNNTGTEFSDVRWVRPSATQKNFNDIFFDTFTSSAVTADSNMQTVAEKGYWI